MYRRKNDHWNKLRQNKHINPIMQSAWNKYGEQAFAFEVLELVLPMGPANREQYWLNKLKPFGRKGFNIARDASAPTLGRKVNLGRKATPETREKMRGRKHSLEARERMRQAKLGKKQLPEYVEKRRQAQIGKVRTPEAREKYRQSKLGNKYRLGKEKSPEEREKISKTRLRLGLQPSPQTIEASRQARLGKPGRKWSPEAIERRSASRRGRKLVDGKFV